MTRVLVTGGNGQVGRSIAELATDERFGSLDITVADRSTADITDRAGLNAVFDRLQPDVVINAAAYTSVDAACIDCCRRRFIAFRGVDRCVRRGKR